MEMLGMVLLVLFGGVAFIALVGSVYLLLPAPVEKTRLRLESLLGRSFLLGLVNLVFFGAVAVLLVWLSGMIRDGWSGFTAFLAIMPGIVALLIGAALVVLVLNGLVALSALLGDRFGTARTEFWSLARGALLLVLACLTPYIGWYVFTPFVACLALGGSILALFQRKASPPIKA